MVKKKLIYIDQLVGPTSLDIINALARDYTVHLYCGGIIKTYAELDKSVVIHMRVSYNKKSFSARFVSWFAFYITVLPFIIIQRNKHVLFLVSNPPLNFILGFVFRKVFQVPFNLLLWDIYPDIIIQTGYISKKSIIARHWSWWNARSFPLAHRIFTVSENLAREIAKYSAVGMNNIRVVPNWVDVQEIRPVVRLQNPFLMEHNLLNSFVVMYSGNMGKTHDLETIVETAALLKNHPDIVFLLIGDGEKKPKIAQMVNERELKNVRLLPFQEPERFKSSVAAAHVGFVTLSAGFENYSVPSKTYYLMATGCIIFAIANKESEMEVIINKYSCGYRFNPGQAGQIADQILKLYKDRQLCDQLQASARMAAGNFTNENAKTIANEVEGE